MCYKEDIVEAQYDIKSFVSKYIFNKSDVPDVMQEINKVLLEKEDSFDVNKAFKAWAIGIAKWQIKAYIQKKKRNREVGFDSPNYTSCETFIGASFSNSIKNIASSSGSKKRDLSEDFDQDSCKHTLSQTLDGTLLFETFYAPNFLKERSSLYSFLEKHLSERDKVIFTHLIKGSRIEEVAESLSLTTIAARTAKFRLIKKLKKLISNLKSQHPNDYSLKAYLQIE